MHVGDPDASAAPARSSVAPRGSQSKSGGPTRPTGSVATHMSAFGVTQKAFAHAEFFSA